MVEDGGIKLINIEATTRYPVVSAYEFEFLKTEAALRERLSGCTIYFIIQRPLTYFTNFRMASGIVRFDIVDDVHEALSCELDLADNEMTDEGEAVEIEVLFYKLKPDQCQPYHDVAGFKIFRMNGEFVVWFSPQKFLYDVLVKGLSARIRGNIVEYLDYHVHYIGKAFSQPVWERLTGHEKMQRILTLEGPFSSRETRAPFEISLLMLDIMGYTESNALYLPPDLLPKNVRPIFHRLETGADFYAFNRPALRPKAEQLTTEVEAKLVNLFRPAYNDVLFNNYPNIAGGTRSVGYTSANLTIEHLPVVLRTAHYTRNLVPS